MSYLRRMIPGSLKKSLRNIYYSLIDILDRLMKRDSLIPPRAMIFVGDGDFEKTGQQFLQHFVELAGLRPDDRVLDVGCGIGRMAIPLTGYLSPRGEYWGFDIVKMGIHWCQRHISTKFKNFHFLHVDIYNRTYNPSGKIQARDFKFPYEPNYFDFVFLTSVFTHMLPADMENYLLEIARVLKPEGKYLITFFLLNEESERLMHAGQSSLDFRYKLDGCRTIDLNNPEAAIAYDEGEIKDLFKRLGLELLEPVGYGAWCKRDVFLNYQDIIIGKKQGIS